MFIYDYFTRPSSLELEICAHDKHERESHNCPFKYLSEDLEIPREIEVLTLTSYQEKYFPMLERIYNQIPELTNLQKLDFNGCNNFSDPEFKLLSKLENLRILTIDTKTDGSGLSDLPDQIQKLQIRVAPENLHHLKRFSKLESLWVYGGSLQPDPMCEIAQLTQIKELIIEGDGRKMFTDESAKHLPSFMQLESLTIRYSTAFTGKSLESIGKIKSLKTLMLDLLNVRDEETHPSLSCSSLESITMSQCGFDEDELPPLKDLPSLKKLHIRSRSLNPEVFSILSNFPSLEEVTIHAHFSDDEKNEGKKWGEIHNVRVIFT